MKELKLLIAELLKLSMNEAKGFPELHTKMKEQDKLMNDIRELAKKEKTLIGRIVKFPRADSYAIYIITKINKKTVGLTWVDYCDGWKIDGAVTALYDIDIASKKVKGEDMLLELFSGK
jgi:hypothetical protein